MPSLGALLTPGTGPICPPENPVVWGPLKTSKPTISERLRDLAFWLLSSAADFTYKVKQCHLETNLMF